MIISITKCNDLIYYGNKVMHVQDLAMWRRKYQTMFYMKQLDLSITVIVL